MNLKEYVKLHIYKPFDMFDDIRMYLISRGYFEPHIDEEMDMTFRITEYGKLWLQATDSNEPEAAPENITQAEIEASRFSGSYQHPDGVYRAEFVQGQWRIYENNVFVDKRIGFEDAINVIRSFIAVDNYVPEWPGKLIEVCNGWNIHFWNNRYFAIDSTGKHQCSQTLISDVRKWCRAHDNAQKSVVGEAEGEYAVKPEAAPEMIHLSAVEIETLDTIIECEPTPDDYAGTDEYYAKEALLSIGFIRKDSAEMLHATDTGKQWFANHAPETVAGETDSGYRLSNYGNIIRLQNNTVIASFRDPVDAEYALSLLNTETASLRATIASKDVQIAALEAENERLREIGDVTSLDWNQKVAELEVEVATYLDIVKGCAVIGDSGHGYDYMDGLKQRAKTILRDIS